MLCLDHGPGLAVEQLACSSPAGENAKWHSRFGKVRFLIFFVVV